MCRKPLEDIDERWRAGYIGRGWPLLLLRVFGCRLVQLDSRNVAWNEIELPTQIKGVEWSDLATVSMLLNLRQFLSASTSSSPPLGYAPPSSGRTVSLTQLHYLLAEELLAVSGATSDCNARLSRAGLTGDNLVLQYVGQKFRDDRVVE